MTVVSDLEQDWQTWHAARERDLDTAYGWLSVIAVALALALGAPAESPHAVIALTVVLSWLAGSSLGSITGLPEASARTAGIVFGRAHGGRVAGVSADLLQDRQLLRQKLRSG